MRNETTKTSKQNAQKRKRLIEIVGNALVTEAEVSPEFHLALTEMLDEIVTETKLRIFLAKVGWL